MIQDAVMRNFQVIGDAVKDISDSFKIRHPEIQWSDYAKFRDVVTHNYLGINLDRVWNFIHTEMQTLKQWLESNKAE